MMMLLFISLNATLCQLSSARALSHRLCTCNSLLSSESSGFDQALLSLDLKFCVCHCLE
ncbi:Uncharacterized protein TCM_042051 [Theobroma cacao]|uniref:Uncharacterized protein n=1 Tax=Theobroma cacao TaxID=3641 RepID=A0A061GYM3_THECC|nr:Uncharacterized protein TCM_042051 [Theobroma cacao]